MKGNFPQGFDEIKTVHPKMLEILRLSYRAARSMSNVLIIGESGTGKELVARGIHRSSPRSEGPFVAVNCGAIPGELLESELMGFEKGAFTGAINRKIGDFEAANGGTIFLDEISSLPLPLQSKLLRVIQEREIKRLGSTRSIKLDVRIISAANVDLEKEVVAGRFRQDLYFRLNVVPIYLPSLRERKGDIPVLLDYFIKKISGKLNKKIPPYSPDIVQILERYPWPGNVRELENIIERIIVLIEDGMPITIKDLPPEIVVPSDGKGYYDQTAEDARGLRERCMVFEKRVIMEALHDTKWNRGKAANLLKIHRNTLIQKMKRLNITPDLRKGSDNISPTTDNR